MEIVDEEDVDEEDVIEDRPSFILVRSPAKPDFSTLVLSSFWYLPSPPI